MESKYKRKINQLFIYYAIYWIILLITIGYYIYLKQWLIAGLVAIILSDKVRLFNFEYKELETKLVNE